MAGLAVPFVELTVAHASVLTILAISFERYYAICEPLRAGYVCTKTRAALICALAWFFAALFTRSVCLEHGKILAKIIQGQRMTYNFLIFGKRTEPLVLDMHCIIDRYFFSILTGILHNKTNV